MHECCEIFKKNFFYRTPLVAAFEAFKDVNVMKGFYPFLYPTETIRKPQEVYKGMEASRVGLTEAWQPR